MYNRAHVSDLKTVVYPAYDELLDVPCHGKIRYAVETQACFLLGCNRPARMSLSFLPDLHTEVQRSWEKLYSVRTYRTQVNYADVEGMQEHGYALKRHWSAMGEASVLKVNLAETEPSSVTSNQNGRAYVAAGQAGVAMHTMAVLQAYQADLLKHLD